MGASRLINPLFLLQRQKPVWDNPELSIGRLCGTTKGKFKYWEAQGPAQEAYDQICTEVREILQGACGPVRCSSAVVYDIYMVGREPETAIPHIMFSCKQPKSRKQAVAAVRSSGIMQQCPGIELGHWEYPPHILNLRLLAFSVTSKDLDIDAQSSYYSFHPISDPQTPSNTLAIQLRLSRSVGDAELLQSTATIGSVTEHHGKMFYVIPQHVFAGPENSEHTVTNDSGLEGDDSDCEFGAFSMDDQISDEEADFISQYSISAPSSDIESDWETDNEDIFSDGEDEYRSIPEPRYICGTTNDDSYESKATPYSPVPLEKHDGIGRIAKNPTMSSQDLDYALIEVDPNDQMLKGLPVLSRGNTKKVSPGIVDVTTVTGSGHLMHGSLSGRPSYVRVPHAGTFQQAFIVDFDGPLLPGDCGSIVRDQETGEIYGHIFLGSTESRVAYIIPAVNIMRDLEADLRRMDPIETHLNVDAKGLSTNTLDSMSKTLPLLRIPGAEGYTVGFICSISMDVDAVRSLIDEEHSHVDKAYVLGSICKHNIVLAADLVEPSDDLAIQMAAAQITAEFPSLRHVVFLGRDGEASRDISHSKADSEHIRDAGTPTQQGPDGEDIRALVFSIVSRAMGSVDRHEGITEFRNPATGTFVCRLCGYCNGSNGRQRYRFLLLFFLPWSSGIRTKIFGADVPSLCWHLSGSHLYRRYDFIPCTINPELEEDAFS